jgi:hypothetical protein
MVRMSTVIHPMLPIVASAIDGGMKIEIMQLSDDRTEEVNCYTFEQSTIAPILAFHQKKPLLATASGQLHRTLEYARYSYLSPEVAIYQLSTDGTCENHQIANLVGHGSPVTAISFCPDDDSEDSFNVATGDNNGDIRIWKIHVSMGSVECVSFFKSPFRKPGFSISTYLISSIHWLNQTKLVASHWNGCAKIIQYSESEKGFDVQPFSNTETGIVKPFFKTETGILTCTGGNPSGEFFVTGGSGPEGGTIQVWSTKSLQPICKLGSISSDIISMEYDATLGLIIVGCLKEVVIVRISPAGDEMHVLRRSALHRRYVTTVAVHTVVTADGDETLALSGTNDRSLVFLKI